MVILKSQLTYKMIAKVSHCFFQQFLSLKPRFYSVLIIHTLISISSKNRDYKSNAQYSQFKLILELCSGTTHI